MTELTRLLPPRNNIPFDQLCFPCDEIISFRQKNEIIICINYVPGVLDTAPLLISKTLWNLCCCQFFSFDSESKIGISGWNLLCYISVCSISGSIFSFLSWNYFSSERLCAVYDIMYGIIDGSRTLKCFSFRLNLVIESRAQDKMSWICLICIAQTQP